MALTDQPVAGAGTGDLDAIVKAYDVRGTVPDQFNAEVAYALGVAFARFTGVPRVLVGRDMRPSGPELVDAFARGATEQGVDVVDLGLVSTDLLYFAAGTLDAPGAVFTASHNPAQYNGVKFCLAGARPVGLDSGLAEVRDIARTVLQGQVPAPAVRAGSRSSRDLLDAFADHVVSFIDTTALRPMRVVADTANGMGGLVVPAVFARIPQITLEVMYGELDGTFPNHPADPLQPANQRDLQARVVAGGFDVGLAFDGDADRVFVVDETGRGLSEPCPRWCASTAACRCAPRWATRTSSR
jgi:phosphomannomutase